MPLLALNIDSLLILLVFGLLSAISSWLQKRRQAQEPSESWPEEPAPPPPSSEPRRGQIPPPPRTPHAPQPSPTSAWEQELRRLLQGEQPGPRPAPPPKATEQPRPVIHPRPLPSAPPLLQPLAPPVKARPIPKPAAAEIAVPRPAEISLANAPTQAAQHARKDVHAMVARQMEAVDLLMKQHTSQAALPRTRELTADVAGARRMVADPATLRQALIASFILAPPKALERREDALPEAGSW